MVSARGEKRIGSGDLLNRLARSNRLAAYVGVPAATSKERSAHLLKLAGVRRGKKADKLRKAAESDLNNAETLFLLSKGSPLRGQPPRPVLEPAVQADGNHQPIARELAAKAKAQMDGDEAGAVAATQRAALAAQNAARAWFTDPRNNWAPNAPSTIRRKGSDRPGIDTGATRAAIVGVVAEE